MYLISLVNTTTQELETNELVNLGFVAREVSSKNKCCVGTFSSSGTSLSLNHKGVYHITVTAIVSAPAAGVVTLQLFANGLAVPGAVASETITTATTELRTLVIDTFILVDSNCVLNSSTVSPVSISIVNTGVDANITNIITNVVKEV